MILVGLSWAIGMGNGQVIFCWLLQERRKTTALGLVMILVFAILCFPTSILHAHVSALLLAILKNDLP